MKPANITALNSFYFYFGIHSKSTSSFPVPVSTTLVVVVFFPSARQTIFMNRIRTNKNEALVRNLNYLPHLNQSWRPEKSVECRLQQWRRTWRTIQYRTLHRTQQSESSRKVGLGLFRMSTIRVKIYLDSLIENWIKEKVALGVPVGQVDCQTNGATSKCISRNKRIGYGCFPVRCKVTTIFECESRTVWINI